MAEVTGRDHYIFGFAIAHALVALESLPVNLQPTAVMQDMRRLLSVADPQTVTRALDAARSLLNGAESAPQ